MLDFDVLTKKSQVSGATIKFRNLNRLKLYLEDCKNDKSSNVRIDLIDESPFHLKGSFPGPEDTPYEGGHFEVVRRSVHLICDHSSQQYHFISRTL